MSSVMEVHNDLYVLTAIMALIVRSSSGIVSLTLHTRNNNRISSGITLSSYPVSSLLECCGQCSVLATVAGPVCHGVNYHVQTRQCEMFYFPDCFELAFDMSSVVMSQEAGVTSATLFVRAQSFMRN